MAGVEPRAGADAPPLRGHHSPQGRRVPQAQTELRLPQGRGAAAAAEAQEPGTDFGGGETPVVVAETGVDTAAAGGGAKAESEPVGGIVEGEGGRGQRIETGERVAWTKP